MPKSVTVPPRGVHQLRLVVDVVYADQVPDLVQDHRLHSVAVLRLDQVLPELGRGLDVLWSSVNPTLVLG